MRSSPTSFPTPFISGTSRWGTTTAPSLLAVHRPPPAAFTLLEIVIVLTILTILVGATIPSFRGLKDEQIAREPVTALARLAKETRLRAMKEKRPYQIAFTSQGFTATRYLSPYLHAAELEEFVQTALQPDAPPVPASDANGQPRASSSASASQLPFQEWTSRYLLPEGSTYSLQFWHESVPSPVAGDLVKLWVFQPSGMLSPLTIRLERGNASFQTTFSALTADIVSEKSELR